MQNPRTAEAEGFLRAFGRRVRRLRLERDLSQQQLGERAGLDRHTINRLETAAHAISTAHLGALARALDVPPQDLMPTPTDFKSEAVRGRAAARTTPDWPQGLQRAQERWRRRQERAG